MRAQRIIEPAVPLVIGDVVPPVVIQLKAGVEKALRPVEESGPGGPCRLISATEEAEVVGLESRRAPLVRGLEHEVLSGDLPKLKFFGVAAQYCAVGIQRKGRIG